MKLALAGGTISDALREWPRLHSASPASSAASWPSSWLRSSAPVAP
jgi:hypothetical protein